MENHASERSMSKLQENHLTLNVEPLGAQAEYSTLCPVCGPVFGVVFFTIEPVKVGETEMVSL
jgi:hypothetical protein